MPRSVYIHIPFCHHICPYCDFNKVVLQGQPVHDYLDALELEMTAALEKHPLRELQTIFVGGGTPTALNVRQMHRFLDSVNERLGPLHAGVEFTMEANPGSVDRELLQVMKEGGVNRLSFGVQSFDDGLLKSLGRIHDRSDVLRSVDMAVETGFENVSIDLMFGLPGQSVRQFEQSLQQSVELPIRHMSVYSLKVEDGTHFYHLQQQGRLPLPAEDEESGMYELAIAFLPDHGFEHYEISNFARPHGQSRHNLTYWLNEEFYGFGAGAHGYVRGVRYENAGGLQEYMHMVREQGLPRVRSNVVGSREQMENMLILGLRLLEGLHEDRFERTFSVPLPDVFGEPLERLQRQGLLAYDAGAYRLTERGLFLGNEVFSAFI